MENSDIKHIAIIMDGNRRWAKSHNLDTKLGHKKGAEVLETISRYCNKIGLEYLTVYAFSTENWKRTKEEVGAIMLILQMYLDRFLKTADLDNIKLRILGDIDGVPEELRKKMIQMEERTKDNTGLNLNIAFNYGGRAEIVRATQRIAQDVLDGKMEIKDINEDTISNNLYTCGQSDPDLVIRTSGELRMSNFLPWQITYSEFLFLDKYWPDFTSEDIDNAINEYNNRHRRIGK
ncbi:isoprenyl transferase [Clostridium sp. CAG:793]|jgi:undecaprenyl diphosphate synthase|nr:isoprenyl transferase [Clostridium sp. CAG:793]